MSQAESRPAKTSRVMVGTVVSDAMDKTIVVKVARRFKHAMLGKTVGVTKTYKVHDESNSASKGDTVEITECRPLSKTKHMTLGRIVRKSV